MSVQSYSYLGGYTGPSIDVNLYPNAMNAGIQAGNAQKTMGQAIAGGVQDAVKNGVSTYQGFQQIEMNSQQIKANDAVNQVNTDPGVIAAKKQVEIARGKIAEAQGKIAATTETANTTTAANNAQVAADNSTLAAADSTARMALNGIVQQGNPQQIAGTFSDPQYAGFYSRNPQLAIQNIQAARAAGADEAILAPLQTQYQGLLYSQNLSAARRGYGSNLAMRNIQKNEAAAANFQTRVDTTPELKALYQKDNFDPALLDITPHPKKMANEATTYDLSYGGQVVKPQAFAKDQYKQASDELLNWKQGHLRALNGATPPRPTQPSQSTAPSGDQPVGLQSTRGTITEKDITPAAQKQDPLETNPVLKGAVKVGGFSPDVVKATIPSFNKLGSTILELSKVDDPYSSTSKTQLDANVQETARNISDQLYKSSSGIQASINDATIEQYNKKLEAELMRKAGKGQLPTSNTQTPQFNFTEEEKRKLARGEDIGRDVPHVHESSLGAFIESQKLKTPEDYFFATQGQTIVKQVQDYAQILLRNGVANQQALIRKNQSLTATGNTLQRMASGG